MPTPRCTLIPLPEHQLSFQVNGNERFRWHFGPQYPRPFLYPLIGPSGLSVTRMGHPGAPDHDHHRSVWFAHFAVAGVDFWSDRTLARVRQLEWLAYQDGEDEAAMAVKLGWFDGHDPKPLLEQDLVIALKPGPDGETFVEFQATFRPTAIQLEFGKTNFGFLAVRMAKALSAFFNGGIITNSVGAIGEPAIFGKPAKWVDYSGEQPRGGAEGVTFFDHPTNPTHPTAWHVREDGWMGASACFATAQPTTRFEPLTLRYLLHVHRGAYSPARAETAFAEFGKRKKLGVVKSSTKHTRYDIVRAS